MNDERLAPLIEAYLDDALGAEDRAWLERAIASDESVRRELVEQLRVAGALQALLGAPEGQARLESIRRAIRAAEGPAPDQFLARVRQRLSARPSRPLWRRRATLGAAGALAAAAVLVLVARGRAPAPHGDPGAVAADPETPLAGPVAGTAARAPGAARAATLERVAGAVYVLDGIHRIPATAGGVIRAGQGVATVGPDSRARLVFGEGSALDVAGNTLVTSVEGESGGGAGPGALLGAGTVGGAIAARPAGAPFVLVTPHARATASAARWSATVADATTRVRVDQGSLRVEGARGGAADVAAGRQALVVAGGAPEAVPTETRGASTAVIFVGNTPLAPADELLRARLEALGFAVQVRGADRPPDAAIRGARVIVVSATVESVQVDRAYRELDVPMVVNESALLDDLGMAEPGIHDSAGPSEKTMVASMELPEILIRQPGHPLAAGLAGRVTVADGRAHLRRAQPGPYAAWVATYGHSSHAFVFGYDRGTPMVDGIAPARRVGFFLHDDTAAVLNDRGWRLFEAAVRWCAEDPGGRAR